VFGCRSSYELELRAEVNAHAWYASTQRDRSLAALIALASAGERFPPLPPPPGDEGI
jgi:hypothetical protein